MYRKTKLVCSKIHIPDQYLMDQKAVRRQPGQPQKRLCGKQPGNHPLADGEQPDQQHRRRSEQHVVAEGRRAQNSHLPCSDEKAAARKQHSCQLQKRTGTVGRALLFAAAVKTAHTAADGKISCPEKRTQIGQVKYGIPTESGFPDYKGEKTLRAENRGSDAAQSASIGLFQHGEQPGKNSIQKSLHRKIPRYAVQTEPETAGGDPCLQQENAYHKLRCTAQDSTPRAEGCARSPFSTKSRAAAIIIRCSGYNLRIF